MPAPTPYYAPHPLAAAKPARQIFDAWNSSSTGHQRAESRLAGSTSWRDSRTAKLGEQFSSGAGGGRRVADTVGAGSDRFGKDGRLESGAWQKGASGLRHDGQQSLFDCMQKRITKPAVCDASAKLSIKRRRVSHDESLVATPPLASVAVSAIGDNRESATPSSDSLLQNMRDEIPPSAQPPTSAATNDEQAQSSSKKVFRNLTIYVNGSTFPLISDHKLKRLLAEHGANISIALGRRTVTHVILGRPNGSSDGVIALGGNVGGGAGGGLAGTKIQKEITNVAGKGVKFVSADWVLDSIAAGKRLPEHAYSPLKLASARQHSVKGMFDSRTKRQALDEYG